MTIQLSLAVDAIKKKLTGKELTYKEIYTVIDQIAKDRLGEILTTYFAACGYSRGFSNRELYFLTKAIVETGEKLKFTGVVADKHSIGGVPGTRTTLIVVPIVAAAGFVIPKSSSRAITTASGTADDMEILAPVTFTKERIYAIVKKTKGCIVWGGNFSIAPADDMLINVEKPLLSESFDKIIVSVMAKKIAFGSNHIVIDLPYGKTVKVHSLKDAKTLKENFEYLAKKFRIRTKVIIHKTAQPAGRGIGPILATRDALRVLQQKENRPVDLEIRSINLAGNLLDICLKDSSKKLQEYVNKNYGNTFSWATQILKRGFAFRKMQEIIKEQDGNYRIDSEDLVPAKHFYKEISKQNATVKNINNKNLSIITKILGAPKQKAAGIFLDKKMNEAVSTGQTVYTLFSEKLYNLKEARQSLTNFPILELV